jgi:uncharacterized protein YfaQ (DUF2300 family)
MTRKPLFAAALGDAWNLVPEPVRRFHGSTGRPGSRVFRGQMDVEWGAAAVARLLCRMLRLPTAGCAIEVHLAVVATEAGEDWRRSFGEESFRTRQWLAPDGRLAESFGPFVLLFHLTCVDAVLHYQLVGMRAFGLPIPRVLLPRVEADEQPSAVDGGVAAQDQAAVQVRVRAWFPRIGLLLRYSGCVAEA